MNPNQPFKNVPGVSYPEESSETAVAVIEKPETNPIPQAAIVQTCGNEMVVSAQTPEEMAAGNAVLIEWCDTKIKSMMSEASEMKEAYELAVKNKWRTVILKKHWQLAVKRVEFYEKMREALKAGFIIVPNFPVTVFAIRTAKDKPLKLVKTSQWNNADHTQKTETLPPGEGEYKNPNPEVYQRDLTQPGDTKKQIQTWAESWRDLDFPINMAKPYIMETTSRVLALKLFDDLGVLPSPYRKADPIIVGRLRDPRLTGYGSTKYLSFFVAWNIDTRTL